MGGGRAVISGCRLAMMSSRSDGRLSNFFRKRPCKLSLGIVSFCVACRVPVVVRPVHFHVLHALLAFCCSLRRAMRSLAGTSVRVLRASVCHWRNRWCVTSFQRARGLSQSAEIDDVRARGSSAVPVRYVPFFRRSVRYHESLQHTDHLAVVAPPPMRAWRFLALR